MAKLLVCRQLDAARGLSEDSVFSAVWALKACYVARRPMFEVTDLTFAVAAEIGEMFFQTMFPSKGRRAITHVSASPF
ncbi:MAG: hypothetical protein Q7S50_03890, partial [bacterium]|nr:hypothetical protein [bacterium]